MFESFYFLTCIIQAILTSTHSSCFRTKIRIKRLPLLNPNCTIKKNSGRDVNYTGLFACLTYLFFWSRTWTQSPYPGMIYRSGTLSWGCLTPIYKWRYSSHSIGLWSHGHQTPRFLHNQSWKRKFLHIDWVETHPITQKCPCNVLRYFTAVKMVFFRWKNVIFFLFLLKT